MQISEETVLRGELADVQALHSSLDRIRDLGLQLIEVRQAPEPEREEHSAAG